MHNHNHEASDKKIEHKKILIAIFLNVFITITQSIAGILSGSISLLTDALHNFSDVISLIVSYIANKLSTKQSTIHKTFGYKRAEILAAFINSTTLIGVAIFLIIESINRFFNPSTIDASIVIVFAICSIIFNFLSVIILHDYSKDNMNIRSSYLHLMTDIATSIAVLLGGFAMKYYNLFWIDSILSLLIAFYLIHASISLLLASTKILMQFAPNNINLNTVSDLICKIDGINNIHSLHVWQLSDKSIMLEAHIELNEDIKISEFQEKIFAIENILLKFNIRNFNLQPELNRCKSYKLIQEIA